MEVPKVSNGVPLWERWELYENLQNPTQMLSYNRMNNPPLHLAIIDFSSAKISFIKSFFGGTAREVS